MFLLSPHKEVEEVEVAAEVVVEVMEEVMELEEEEVVPYGIGGEVIKTVLPIVQQMMKVNLKINNLIMVVL